MSRRCIVIVGVAAIVALCAGCSSSSDGGTNGGEPENVAGVWSLALTNADDVVFTQCAGDLIGLGGDTLAEVLALGPACDTADPWEVTQFESVFTFVDRAYTCDGGAAGGTYGGGGSVNGNTLYGELETLSDVGWLASEAFNGAVNSGSLAIGATGITYTGTLEGSCRFTPRAQYSGGIAASARGAEGAGPDALPRAVPAFLARRAESR